MKYREIRLAAIEERAMKRIARRRALLNIAVYVLNGRKQAEYAMLRDQAVEMARRVFIARVEAGAARWGQQA